MTKRRVFYLLTFLLAFIVALMLLVWAGSIKWPVPRQGGTVLVDGERLKSCGASIRVGTYNIHGATGLDGERSLGRIAEVLAASELDVIGLNEVRDDVLSSQAPELAARLDLAWLYAPTRRKLLDGFGNAVLSRCAIIDYEVVPLLQRFVDADGIQVSRAYRNLVRMRATLAGRSVTIFMTHLDRGALRERQLQAVLDEFLSASPAILMGDLNTGHEGALKKMLSDQLAIDATAGLAGEGVPHGDHIDWILTRGLRVNAVGGYRRGPSDHPHYWAEVSLLE